MSTTAEVNAYEVEVREILGKLQQSDRETIVDWLSKQHRLEVEGPKGYSNCAVIVSWLLNRKFAVNEHNLTMALTNVQNNSRRPLFWKPLPKADRSTATGRINYALVKSEEPKVVSEREYIHGRKNHAHTSLKEATTQAVGENFEEKAETVVGRTHGATAQAQRILVTIPNSSVIDWEQTYRERLRFVNRQQAAVRR